ncbi:hypothetical protein ILYODFUR_038058 [Ilyodon furcidens]|uniref:Uncharacterized protein n=1 Tax=Ilyodon furcidens TaxID=33524 RepID=A0ABV0UMD3_9TELE
MDQQGKVTPFAGQNNVGQFEKKKKNLRVCSEVLMSHTNKKIFLKVLLVSLFSPFFFLFHLCKYPGSGEGVSEKPTAAIGSGLSLWMRCWDRGLPQHLLS